VSGFSRTAGSRRSLREGFSRAPGAAW